MKLGLSVSFNDSLLLDGAMILKQRYTKERQRLFDKGLLATATVVRIGYIRDDFMHNRMTAVLTAKVYKIPRIAKLMWKQKVKGLIHYIDDAFYQMHSN